MAKTQYLYSKKFIVGKPDVCTHGKDSRNMKPSPLGTKLEFLLNVQKKCIGYLVLVEETS